jgi:hypothetical protein
MQLAQPAPPYRLEFDPRLMEDAVLLRVSGHAQEAEFHQERERIYDIADEEKRDKRFHQLHQQWFIRLDLAHTVESALGDYPLLGRDTRGCRVMFAMFSKEEGADLYGASPATIIIKLRPSSLLDASTLLTFLRHEFMHLHDILDPCFAYQLELPQSEVGPTYDNLIRERYRVLWDTWIDGRLLARGWAPARVKQKRRAEFEATFSMLGQSLETKFSQWFDWPVHKHEDLLDFALHPESEHLQDSPQQIRTGRCPLCRFPSFDLQNGWDLSQETVQEIIADFPDWTSDQGLCRQCSDLYQARELSRSAEAALPGNPIA